MPHRAAAALAATVLLWASAFAAIRAALEHFRPGHLSALRLLVAAVALGAVAAARGITLPAARDLPAIAAVAFAGMTAYQLLLNSGEQTVPAGTAALLINVSPVFTAVAASVLLNERMTPLRWAGVAIACAGASLIALAGHDGVALEQGALFVLGAAVAQAAFFVGQKPLLHRYGSFELDDLGDGARHADDAAVRAPASGRGRRGARRGAGRRRVPRPRRERDRLRRPGPTRARTSTSRWPRRRSTPSRSSRSPSRGSGSARHRPR